MKKVNLFILSIIALLFSCTKESIYMPKDQRITKHFNTEWQFTTDSSASVWEKISIPHTPKIEPLVVNNQFQGNMWYKKKFTITDSTKNYFLRFEGIMHEADIWINNKFVSKHVGGYLPCIIDLSDYISYKSENEIILNVNNEDNPIIPPGKPLGTLDFNYYGGIYRNVELIETNKIYITDPILENNSKAGVLIHLLKITNEYAEGIAHIHARNNSDSDANLETIITFTDASNKKHVFNSLHELIKANDDKLIKINFKIHNPLLWSTAKPNLYKTEIQIFNDKKLVDDIELNTGIRTIKLTKNDFYLNGEKKFIRGTNRHQEYPYVGYAISKNANYRDAVKIKQAGFDFVRLSHYPQDESFLDACDKLGILVMNAIPGWQFFGDSFFVENSYQDIRNMVRRDRNHPSVIFWEVSLNESGMTEEYMIKANKILKEELPFNATYSAGWIDHSSYDLFIPARQHGKPPKYWSDYKNNERPLFIAEYGDWEYYAQNAGFNQTQFQDLKEEERSSRHLRSAGEKRLLQQALNFQEAANSNRKGKSTIGDANWLMFDYNRGYADDIEASGISDIFRIPKFAYYFYQSQRPPFDTAALKEGTGPMVKIATYWQAESNTNIKVYSNCEEVELYLNDSLIERAKPTINQFSDHLRFPPFIFNIKKFEPGKLKAKAYINEKLVVEDVIQTPLAPKSIIIEIDESTIPISNIENDIIIVHAKLVDANGTIVPSNSGNVQFITSEGNLIGENPAPIEAGIASILLKVKIKEKLKISCSFGEFNSSLIF